MTDDGSIIAGFLDNTALDDNSGNLSESDYALFQSKTAKSHGRFIAGRILTRTMIAELTDEDAPGIALSVDSRGSPVHVHPHPVRFSISHSCNLSAAAVLPVASMHNKLGIDLEQRIPGRDVDAIAEAWFHPLECRLLDKAANNEQRLRLFYKMWTAKEAWVKARRLSVWKVGSIPILEFVQDGGSGLWLELPGNYTLAIHVSGDVAVEDVRIHPGFEYPGVVNARDIYAGSFAFSNYTGDRT